jgi:hypothetical protein
MKPRLVLLYTHDRNFDRLLSEALIGTGAIVLIARSVGDALQVVSSRWRELDFAILDFNDGCRGMAPLSALHTSCENLPTVVGRSSLTSLARPAGRGGFSSQIDSTGRVLFTADAHHDDGRRFIVWSDEQVQGVSRP